MFVIVEGLGGGLPKNLELLGIVGVCAPRHSAKATKSVRT